MPDSNKYTGPETRRHAWATYWNSGAIASCQGAACDNYRGEIRAWWQAFFAALPSNTRILDIGTGNGAIAKIGAEVSNQSRRNLEIHAIDIAPIDPIGALGKRAGPLSEVYFHPSTPAEATGFPDGHFGAVSGQYALEYTDIAKSTTELARISAQGAKLCLIMHRHDSIVADRMREQIGQTELLLNNTHLFEVTDRLFRAVNTPREKDALATFRQNAAIVIREASRSQNPGLLNFVLDSLGRLYESRNDLSRSRMLEELQELEAATKANHERLRDLKNALMTENDLKEVVKALRRAGFRSLQTGRIKERNDASLGWTLTGVRARENADISSSI